MDVDLLSATGEATIELKDSGGMLISSYTVASRSQEAEASLPEVSLPVNATSPLWINLRLNSEADLSVSVSATTVTLTQPLGATISAGESSHLVWVQSPGTTGTDTIDVVEETGAFPAISVDVDVRAAEVSVSETQINLLQMVGRNAGSITIDAPEGVTFASFTPPKERRRTWSGLLPTTGPRSS